MPVGPQSHASSGHHPFRTLCYYNVNPTNSFHHLESNHITPPHRDRHRLRIPQSNPHRQLHLPLPPTPPIPIQAQHPHPHIITPNPISPPPFQKPPPPTLLAQIQRHLPNNRVPDVNFLPSIPRHYFHIFREAAVGFARRAYRGIGSEVWKSVVGRAGWARVDGIEVFIDRGGGEGAVGGAEKDRKTRGAGCGGGIRCVGQGCGEGVAGFGE